MHLRRLLSSCAATALLLALCAAQTHAQPQGRELAQAVYDRYVGDDSVCSQVMSLIPESGQSRERKLEISAIDRGGLRKSLLRFAAPADIAGTGFLAMEDGKGGTEQFLYLPALKRSRRIVAGQKGRSFVNTDFTYEDMERRPVDDSEHAVTAEEDVDGLPCWILESRPKPGTESQYSSVRAWVAKDMNLAVRVDFFIGGPEPVKRLTVNQLENVQEIWTATEVTMQDLQSGHRTVLKMTKIAYNTGLQEAGFTQQSLENW
jgi:hypothetical protein